MDPVKIILFLAVFGALLVLGRILSSSSEVHAASLPHPEPSGGQIDAGADAAETSSGGQGQLPITGADFGFPFKIPAVKRLDDGSYNRPNFVDYHFSKTDLVRGPADPDCFFDELCLKAQDPEDGHTWELYYTVATPSGLRKVMDEEKFATLYLDGGAVIVPRWDLDNILHTVVDELMKAYGDKYHDRGVAGQHSDDTTHSSQDVS